MKTKGVYFLAVAVVAAGIAGPVSAGAIVFHDVTFLDSEWSAAKTFDNSPVQNGVFTAGQMTSGGNTDAFRQTQLNVTGNGGFLVSHLRNGAVYDPTISGAIETIDFSLDVRFLSGSSGTSQTLYELDLLQNGAHYLSNATAALALGPGNGAAGGWQSFSFSGLMASDFLLFAGAASATPDFSATGSLIQFGFLNTVSESFGIPLSVTSGVDNWSVTISPVPEPATILLLGCSLAGLGGAALRRRQLESLRPRRTSRASGRPDAHRILGRSRETSVGRG